MSDSSALSDRDRQFHAILADYLEAKRLGAAPARDALLAKHPEFAAELASFLADQAVLERVAPADRPAPGETLSHYTIGNVPTIAPGERLPAPGEAIRYFGDYELIDELARGGMGVVYRARQVSLNRVVALKMILSGHLASASDVARFRAEATAAANLDHPNIVPIYEVGEHDGRHYFSMKLVEGGSLAHHLAATPRPPVRELVGWLVAVARAVEFAHQRGILHRDLKPANILLASGGREPPGAMPEGVVPSQDSRPISSCIAPGGSRPPLAVPFVTDFGLAKQVEDGSQLTASGSILGTPSYMPPEQATGAKGLSAAADVYSLGAILYEVLTSRPPFRADSLLETLRQVREEEPARPRAIDPSADPDLETVALKCLEKEPGRRYPSAAALADELQRWLDGVPIAARPATSVERAWKWAKRRPAIAGLLAAVAASLLVGTSVSAGFAVDAGSEAKRANEAATKADLAKAAADRRAESEKLAHDRAEKSGLEEKSARKVAEDARKEEADARAKEQTAKLQAVAERNAKDKEYVRADGLRLAAEADAARFRDPGLALLLAAEAVKRTPHHITFSALYAALADCREERSFFGTSSTWDDSGWHVYQGDATLARYLPGAKRVLAAAGSSLRVWDIETGKVVGEWKGYNLKITGVAVSPDGARAAVITTGYAPVRHPDGTIYNYTDRVVYVVDLAKGADVVRLRGSKQTQGTVEFDKDGKRILASSWDGFARVYDAATGKLLREINTGQFTPLAARFTPDGKHVLTVTTNTRKASYGYDEGTWGDKKKYPTDPEPIEPGARPLGPSQGGSGSDHGFTSTSTVAELWDAETGASVVKFTKAKPSALSFGHVWYPKAADLSADGKLLAVAFPGVVGVWETATGKYLFDAKGHEGDVAAVAFRPGGKQLATAGVDKTVRLWDLADGREVLRLRGHAAGVAGLRFSADGKKLATRSDDQTARVWDADSGAELAVLRGHGGAPKDVEFRPDGLRVVTAGDISVRVWNLEPAKTLDLVPRGHAGKITLVAYSPDGTLVLTASEDQTARLWETATGKLVRAFGDGRPLGELRSAKFSPDGKRVVTAAANRGATAKDKTVRSAVVVWDVATGKELVSLDELPTGATAAEFSPDGKRILTVGDGYLRLKYNAKDPKAKAAEVGGITFDLSTGGTARRGMQHLWDADTGKLIATLFQGKQSGWTTQGERATIAFTPDGQHFLTVDRTNYTPTLYRTADGKPVRTYKMVGRWGGSVATGLSPDGRAVLVSKSDTLALFDAESGMLVVTLKDFPVSVRDFTYSADGRVLAVAAHKSVFVYAMPDRKLVTTLKGHSADVATVAVSPDGSRRVMTGAEDGTAVVWDAATGRMLSLFQGHTGKLTAVLFRADGQQAATLADDGTARLWPVDLGPAVRARMPRALTDDEYDRYEVAREPGQGPKTARRQDKTPRSDPPEGAPLPERFALPPPAGNVAARQAELRDLAGDRAKLHEFRLRHAGTAEAAAAAGLLAKLPAPLDELDAKQIAPTERAANQAKELVAVLGESRQRHTSPVERVAVSASGKVVGSRDNSEGQTRFWDADTLDARGQLPGKLLGFAKDRDEAFVTAEKGFAAWDVSGPEPKKVKDYPLPAANSIEAVSADGRYAVGAGPGWEEFRLWDVTQGATPGRSLHKSATRSNEVYGAAFSADSTKVALHLNKGRLVVFDVRDATKPAIELAGPDNYNAPPAFSPDGTRLAAATGNAILVWDLAAPTTPVKLPGQTARTFAFTPDGRTLYATYYRRDGIAWDLTASPPKEAAALPAAVAAARALAFAPDGKRVYVGVGVAVRGFDADGWRERRPLVGHGHAVSGLAFAADGRTLYSADDSDTLRAWAFEAGAFAEKRAVPGFADRFNLPPDERTLVAGKYGFSLWDAAGLTKRSRDFDPHNYGPVAQALSADGRWLARGSLEPALSVYDLSGPEPREHAVVKAIADHRSVRSVAVSPDGAFVAAAFDQDFDGTPVLVWRVTPSGLKPVAFPYLTGEHIAFAPDGKTFAAAGGGTVTLVDLASSAPIERLTLDLGEKGHGSNLRVLFTADAARVVTVREAAVTVWDAATSKKVIGWTLPGAATTAVTPDGRHLAVGNANGTVWVLRVP